MDYWHPSGWIVALILRTFYSYLLNKVEGILNKMEDGQSCTTAWYKKWYRLLKCRKMNIWMDYADSPSSVWSLLWWLDAILGAEMAWASLRDCYPTGHTALFTITIMQLFALALWHFSAQAKLKPQKSLNAFLIIVGFMALFAITYAIGDATPISTLNADSWEFNTPMWLKVTDVALFKHYPDCINHMLASALQWA